MILLVYFVFLFLCCILFQTIYLYFPYFANNEETLQSVNHHVSSNDEEPCCHCCMQARLKPQANKTAKTKEQGRQMSPMAHKKLAMTEKSQVVQPRTAGGEVFVSWRTRRGPVMTMTMKRIFIRRDTWTQTSHWTLKLIGNVQWPHPVRRANWFHLLYETWMSINHLSSIKDKNARTISTGLIARRKERRFFKKKYFRARGGSWTS